jgi:hypothetical protein
MEETNMDRILMRKLIEISNIQDQKNRQSNDIKTGLWEMTCEDVNRI